MAAIKNITPIKALALLGALLCVLMAGHRLWLASEGVNNDAEVTNNQVRQLIRDAQQEKSIAARLKILTDARVLQEEALADAPADPFGWARLAELRLATQNNREGALAALQMSAHVAPYVPSLMVDRAFGLYALRDVPGNDNLLLAASWRGALRNEPDRVLEGAKKNPDLIVEVAAAVQQDEFLAGRWQRMTKQFKTKNN